MYDVVVVGGGVMGSAAAWALATAGREVLVLERFGPDHDRGGSHGASRLFRLAHDNADYIRLARRALQIWGELQSDTGVDLLTTTGSIDHGLAAGELESYTTALTAEDVPFDVLSPVEATRRWPGMRFASPVLYQPDGGRLRADLAVRVLQQQAVDAGAQIRHHHAVRVVSIRDHGSARGAVVDLRTDDGAIRARRVVVAVGSWAPSLLGGIVSLPPLRVTQEQPAHFTPHDPDLAWPSFVHWRRGSSAYDNAESYGLFAPGAGVKVGLHAAGTVVDPDARDFRPTAAGTKALHEYVRSWLPGVDADPSSTESCLYDNTSTGDFVVDRHGPLTVATGFSGHGFKFAPVIGQLLTDLVTGRGEAPSRFRLSAHCNGDRRTG